eukprot:13625869-Alexandrium_andersonii.AAC.1
MGPRSGPRRLALRSWARHRTRRRCHPVLRRQRSMALLNHAPLPCKRAEAKRPVLCLSTA